MGRGKAVNAMKKITKVLIANRGEIALRIIRACRELGIRSVAIFSEVDTQGIWVRKADECYPFLGHPLEAYLDYKRIIKLALKAGCDAIHPGYGFLHHLHRAQTGAYRPFWGQDGLQSRYEANRRPGDRGDRRAHRRS